MKPWIAIDWGTSTLRGWLLAPNNPSYRSRSISPTILDFRSKPLGVKFVKNFGEALIKLTSGWWNKSDPNIFACGMVGSSIGWKTTPYLEVGIEVEKGISSPLTSLSYRHKKIHLIPGWRCGKDDVMRGEETMVMGLTASGSKHTSFTGTLVIPGTHCKWVSLKSGKAERFITSITGEMFEVLSKYSILKNSFITEKTNKQNNQNNQNNHRSFKKGVLETKRTRLMANLFKLRANFLHHIPDQYQDRFSGQLIAEEILTLEKIFRLQPTKSKILLTGDSGKENKIKNNYLKAFQLFGYRPKWIDGATLVLRGLNMVRNNYFNSSNEI